MTELAISPVRYMKRLIYFLSLACLTSCSITGRYYLRNLSDQPATVTIISNEHSTSDKWNDVTFKYDDKVRDIKFGMFRNFKKEIKVRPIDMSRVEFTIPPKSTVFIGIGINSGFWGGFEQVKVRVGEKEQSFSTNDHIRMNLKMKGLMRYTGHYDIVI